MPHVSTMPRLHTIGAYSNPGRTEVRPRLARKWISDVLDSGSKVTVVEHGFGDRPYEFSPLEPAMKHVNLVQVRGGPEHELWLQHALYNRGIATTPESDEYICWQDMDVEHERSDWAEETVHALQHYKVVQTWTHAVDLDPKGNIATNEWDNAVDRSFCAAWLAGEVDPKNGPYAPAIARALLPKDKPRDWRSHTGYSWAIRRRALKGIGRLLDWMIIGSGDYHMAHGFAGNLKQMCWDGMSADSDWRYCDAYFRKLLEFANLCERHIQQDIGVVDGTLKHGWHGSKKLRFYGSREDVMRESKFNPDTDIAFDFNGLPYLCSDNRMLRDGIRRYNRRRNEDSIDIY